MATTTYRVVCSNKPTLKMTDDPNTVKVLGTFATLPLATAAITAAAVGGKTYTTIIITNN